MSRSVPFGDDPIRVKKLSREQIDAMAANIARQIKKHADGPYNVIQTWIDAAWLLGCNAKTIKRDDPFEGEGLYNPKAPGGPTLYYRVRPGDSVLQVCAKIIHELAHHLLIHWKGSRFPAGWERYDGSRTDQHEIARKVEYLVLKCEDIDE